MTDDAQLFEAFSQELAQLMRRQDRVSLEIYPVDAFILLSHLQLALRHPQNTGASALRVEHLAHRLETLLDHLRIGPAIKQVSARGWYEVFDVPQDAEATPRKVAIDEDHFAQLAEQWRKAGDMQPIGTPHPALLVVWASGRIHMLQQALDQATEENGRLERDVALAISQRDEAQGQRDTYYIAIKTALKQAAFGLERVVGMLKAAVE